MQDKDNIDYSQLVNAAEAARLKGMQSNHMAYHLASCGAPAPVYIGRGKHAYYQFHEIEAWQPNRSPNKSRKSKRNSPAGGGS